MKVRPITVRERASTGIQIKTILNHVQRFKSFVYGEARLLANTKQPILEIEVHERRNSWALCSVCEQPSSSYDRQRFSHLQKYRNCAISRHGRPSGASNYPQILLRSRKFRCHGLHNRQFQRNRRRASMTNMNAKRSGDRTPVRQVGRTLVSSLELARAGKAPSCNGA